jgi:hypothetical protein
MSRKMQACSYFSAFIISGHPDWKKSFIKVFSTCKPGQFEDTRRELADLMSSGRLPITEKNVEIIEVEHGSSVRSLINENLQLLLW